MKITERMIDALAREYPGKKIIRLPETNPQEVICEVAASPDGSWSLAVALIAKSLPHYHDTTCEAYRVLKGAVRIMDGAQTRQGKVLTSNLFPTNMMTELGGIEYIWPGRVHCAWAVGRWPAKVLVLATPVWSPRDHHIRHDIKKPFDLT